MTPLIGIVGKSGMGKTTLLEKLIPEIIARGYRVGTIKHDAHGFEVDHPGKDSWRHAQAGAWSVIISSPNKMALMGHVDREKSIDELAEMIGDSVDIILTEGFKHGKQRKVEISRSAVSTELLCTEDELLAIVSDKQHPMHVPQFGLDDVKGLADLLEEAYLRDRRCEVVTMTIDGRRIPLKAFVQDMFDQTIRGMVSSLHGTEDAGTITIKLRPADANDRPADDRQPSQKVISVTR